MSLNVNVNDTIFKPQKEVYDAIFNKEKIIKYFPTNSSGDLVPKKKIKWEFVDHGVVLTIQVLKVEAPKYLLFEWEATGKPTTTEIKITAKNATTSSVEITERTFEMDAWGVKKALEQTQGWTDFICSLKAYLYAGINIRTGEVN